MSDERKYKTCIVEHNIIIKGQNDMSDALKKACARGEHEPMAIAAKWPCTHVVYALGDNPHAGYVAIYVCRHCKAVYFKYEEV